MRRPRDRSERLPSIGERLRGFVPIAAFAIALWCAGFGFFLLVQGDLVDGALMLGSSAAAACVLVSQRQPVFWFALVVLLVTWVKYAWT
jgi:hypothetical protein